MGAVKVDYNRTGLSDIPGKPSRTKRSRKPIPPRVRSVMRKFDIEIHNERRFAGLSIQEQLDFLATRIIADDRNRKIDNGAGINDLIDSGILSPSQYERRYYKEVYSSLGLGTVVTEEMQSGVFGRAYVNYNEVRGLRDECPSAE